MFTSKTLFALGLAVSLFFVSTHGRASNMHNNNNNNLAQFTRQLSNPELLVNPHEFFQKLAHDLQWTILTTVCPLLVSYFFIPTEHKEDRWAILYQEYSEKTSLGTIIIWLISLALDKDLTCFKNTFIMTVGCSYTLLDLISFSLWLAENEHQTELSSFITRLYTNDYATLSFDGNQLIIYGPSIVKIIYVLNTVSKIHNSYRRRDFTIGIVLGTITCLISLLHASIKTFFPNIYRSYKQTPSAVSLDQSPLLPVS